MINFVGSLDDFGNWYENKWKSILIGAKIELWIDPPKIQILKELYVLI